MKSARWLFLSLAAVGCVGQAEGVGTALEDTEREVAEATQLLIDGERPGDVAKAYPSLRISSGTRPVDPDPASGGGTSFPKPPPGIGPISTPVEPEPEVIPNPLQPVRPGGDPVEPEPETSGPSRPTSPVDPTMDPPESDPENGGPESPEPGDESIADKVCHEECKTTTTTKCSTVYEGSAKVEVRVCHAVTDTVCRPVCTEQ